MKQNENHKKETHIHCLFTGSRFITLKENPGNCTCIKIFSYGLSTQDHGEGEGGGGGGGRRGRGRGRAEGEGEGGGGEPMQEICYVPGVFFTFHRARTTKPFVRQSVRFFCHS